MTLRPGVSSAVASTASTEAHHGSRPVASLSWLTTIRARLYIALGFMAAITVIGSLIALYTFTNIGATTTETVSQSMPAPVHSRRLAEEPSGLAAPPPQRMTLDDDAPRSSVAVQRP